MFTKKRIKMAVGLLAGFVAGVAFVVACNGGRGADAQTACLRWEVVEVFGGALTETGQTIPQPAPRGAAPVLAAPDGWEPFAYASNSYSYVLRRCAN